MIIDKPGIYEDSAGERFVFSTTEPMKGGDLFGSSIKKSEIHFYQKNGMPSYCHCGEHVRPIVKFVSSTFNFEKGEPI